MNQPNDNEICECGHAFFQHEIISGCCVELISTGNPDIKWTDCPCQQFKPKQNIKYAIAADCDNLSARIADYLSCGGLFNPELMEHDKVSKLLQDCRNYIDSNSAPKSQAGEEGKDAYHKILNDGCGWDESFRRILQTHLNEINHAKDQLADYDNMHTMMVATQKENQHLLAQVAVCVEALQGVVIKWEDYSYPDINSIKRLLCNLPALAQEHLAKTERYELLMPFVRHSNQCTGNSVRCLCGLSQLLNAKEALNPTSTKKD